MTALGRRELLRMAAPAVALPMVAAAPALTKEMRLVTRDEIMEAFRFFDNMELRAEDLNLRYQILIDMLFETNPETLRAKLNALIEGRRDHMVLVDADTGQVAPYDPSMYEQLAKTNAEIERIGRERVEQQLAPVQEKLQAATFKPLADVVLPKPKLRYRLAAWLMGWRA
jgi:hypothetical protein